MRSSTTPTRRDRGRSRSVASALALTLLPLGVVSALAGPAQAAGAQPGDAYTLAPTVSPAPMVAADRVPGARCILAPTPSSGGVDDQPALAAAVAQAAALTTPAAVVDGVVVTSAVTATVLLDAGDYLLARPLLLPPDVDLRGRGITATTLVLAPASWGNFGYSFLIKPDGTSSAGSSNLVSDLTVNGNCRVGAGAPDPAIAPARTCDLGAPSSYGGGIKAGDRWTVRQIRFTNLNYFKLWIAGTRDAQAIDNRFDNWGGAGAGDEDNIGGGAGATGTVLEHNQFDETIRGNSVDFTNASQVAIRFNTVHATKAYLSMRNVGDYGSMYLEGVTASTVASNVLYGSHLVLQSNSRYDHSGSNRDVTNARGIAVADNEIVDSFHTGITVVYDNYVDEPGQTHVHRPGGANVFTGNTITRPTQSGILVVGCNAESKDAADTLTGNTVRNAGFGGSTSFATGCGTFDTAGLGLSTGAGDLVAGNTIVDDQATPTTWYGIHVGARNGKTAPTGTILVDPAGQAPANTATGVIGGLIRAAAGAPAPVTELVAARQAGAVNLTWKDAYQSAGSLAGGYRVYRNGTLAANLPVGTQTIVGNLVSAAQFSMEGGADGWTRVTTRTVIGQNPTIGAIGTASLALTVRDTAGQVSAVGSAVAVMEGQTYTATASFQALASGSKVRAGIAWLDASNVSLGKVLPSTNVFTDAVGAWLTSTYSAKAPAGAVRAQPFVVVDNCVVGQTHLVDRVGLVAGTTTETWTDPTAPAGPVTYQVVTYRTGDGENSAVTSVPVS